MTKLHRLALLAALAGCSPPEGGGTIAGDVLLGYPRPSNRPLEQALGPNGHHVIYVNFDGVAVLPDYDDSIHNKSSIAASIGHGFTVPAFNSSDYSLNLNRDQVIADVMTQARKFYADFNVDLVTSRPQSGDYTMTAVGGDPSLIGEPCSQNGCVAGIAPLDCQPGGQGIQYNVSGDVEIVYAFSATAKVFGGSYQSKVFDLAVTIAQETAHAYGLGHTNNPQDVMYPVETGQTVGFLSGSYADSNNCAGGQGQQDSHGLLLKILGASQGPADNTPPTVSITSPGNGATVPRTFGVSVSASDNVGVDHVQVQANGPGTTVSQRIDAPPYNTTLNLSADGAWAISATAYDAIGNSGLATINITVAGNAKLPLGSACGSGADCASGTCASVGGAMTCTQSCGAMPCPAGFMCNSQQLCEKVAMPQPGEVGATCTGNGDCHSGICADYGGRHFCTQPCTVGDPMSCPAGLFCTNFGADGNLCAPRVGGTGGGCAVAPRRDGGLAVLSLLLLALAFRRRR